jgi:hypothetical protein
MLINTSLVAEVMSLSPDLGWGWRFLLIGRARRTGSQMHSFEAELLCPPDQRSNDLSERIHRMLQLLRSPVC